MGKVSVTCQTVGVYRYTVTGFKPMKHVISYFEVFPLKTKKALSFEKWLAIYNIVSNKLHLSEKGLALVRAIQKEININNSMTNKTRVVAHP